MPGPRLRTCSVNNLPPRWMSLSPGVWRETALWLRLCSQSWELSWKGSMWCLKASGGWEVVHSNQEMYHSSRGFPSLLENMGSSTDSCLTWAELQMLPGEGRVLCRAQPGERHLQSPGKPGVQRLPLVQPCQALGASSEKAVGEPSVVPVIWVQGWTCLE